MEYLHQAWWWIASNADPIQAVCVVLSAGAAFAVFSHASRLSRREKTIDMIEGTLFSNGEGAGLRYTTFKNLARQTEEAGKRLADYYPQADEDQVKAYDIIVEQLNYFEIVSLGIRQGVFDEKLYKYWFQSQFLADFKKLWPFIQCVQTEHGASLYSEMMWLRSRWMAKAHPLQDTSKMKIVWWAVTGKWLRVQEAVAKKRKRLDAMGDDDAATLI